MPLDADNRDITAGSTPKIYCTIRNHAGTALALADVLTLTLTYWDKSTDIKIRDGLDALNVNGVTMHATSGLVTWQMTTADTTLVSADPNVYREVRQFVYRFTWDDGGTTQVGYSDPKNIIYLLNPEADYGD
jgi:hypothetical protein